MMMPRLASIAALTLLPAFAAKPQAVISLNLSLNSETRIEAGQAPGNTVYFTFPSLEGYDEEFNPLPQLILVQSPNAEFQGAINHPEWGASSLVYQDLGEYSAELFDNGDWSLRDNANLNGGEVEIPETVYTFGVMNLGGALDGLEATFVNDDLGSLNLESPTFTWSPSIEYDQVNTYLWDRTNPQWVGVASDVLAGDATEWSPGVSLVPGRSYHFNVTRQRGISGAIEVGTPSNPNVDFPYEWNVSGNVYSIGIYEFTAVPEPQDYAAWVGAGLLAMAAYRRMKRSGMGAGRRCTSTASSGGVES